MAFVPGNSPDQGANSDQDKQKNPLADQAPITSAPAGGGTGKPSGQASNKAPSQPFTNLSSYLSANAPQVQEMSNNIAGTLNSDYNATSGAIDTAKSQYGSDVNAGYTPADQSVIDSFNTNPAGVANDPTQAAKFKGMYNDRYTGPANFQDTAAYGDLSGKIQKSQALANQVSTVPGLQSYLSSTSPTYTQGEATLDSALLGTNPDAVQTVSDATKPFAQLPGYLNDAVTSGNAASQNAVAQAQAAKAAAQGAGQTAQKNLATNLTNENAAAEAAYQKSVADYQKYIAGVQDEQTMKGIASGINQIIPQYTVPDIYKDLANPAGAPAMYDPAAIASGNDYATDAALSQLMGVPGQLDPTKAGMSGSWNPQTYQTPDLTAMAAYTANPLFDKSGQQIVVNDQQSDAISQLLKQLQKWNGQVPSSPISAPTGTGPGGGPPYLQPPTVNPDPGRVTY